MKMLLAEAMFVLTICSNIPGDDRCMILPQKGYITESACLYDRSKFKKDPKFEDIFFYCSEIIRDEQGNMK